MWKRIKRMYYQWVIRDCQRDIRELTEYRRDNIEWLSPYTLRDIHNEIVECREAIKRARAKL